MAVATLYFFSTQSTEHLPHSDLCSSSPFFLSIFLFLLSATFSRPGMDSPHYKGSSQVFFLLLLVPSSYCVVSHLFIRVLSTPNGWCQGWWEVKFRHWSVWVFFLYTGDFSLPSSFLVNLASRKGCCPSRILMGIFCCK